MAITRNALSLNDLNDELARSRVRPIYVLTGEERYLIEQVETKLKAACLAPEAEAFDCVRLADWRDSDAVVSALATPPLLSGRKVVIVEDSDLFASASKAQARALGAFSFSLVGDGACLILREPKVLSSGVALARMKALEEASGCVVTLPRQSERLLITWLRRLAQTKALTLPTDVAKTWIRRSESDMTTLRRRFDVVSLYAQALTSDAITMAMLDDLVDEPLDIRIFDLLDAVSAQDTARAFRTLDDLSATEPAAKILFMVMRQIRQLLVATDLVSADRIREALSVHEYTAKRLARFAHTFPPEALASIHARGYGYDVDVKRGLIDDQTALVLLITYACDVA